MTIVDLSMTLDPDTVYNSPVKNAAIRRISHAEAGKGLTRLFEGLVISDLPDGEGCAMENINLSTHHGTHLDAPFHYHSKTAGLPSPTIDEVPLEWCYAPGVKLDLRFLDDGHLVSVDDLQRALDKVEHQLSPYEIVLANTSAGGAHHQRNYFAKGCGFSDQATKFLIDAGVKIVGTDAASWDIPLPHMIENHLRTGDARAIFQAHKFGRHVAYCQLEKLANLEALPDAGFHVCCFPFKIKGASAGFTRAVAILSDALSR